MLAEEALSEPERHLVHATRTGGLVDVAPLGNDSAAEAASGDTVRAEVLTELLVRAGRGDEPPSRGVRLRGARITGTLDLSHAELVCPLALLDCTFDERVVLEQTRAVDIRLAGCTIPRLSAGQLTVRGNLDLSRLRTTQLDLWAADIGGWLNLDGAEMSGPGGLALAGTRLTVGQWMTCSDGFRAVGEVGLVAATVRGALSFTGAGLHNPGGWALNAQGIDVGYALFLGSALDHEGEFFAEGGVRLNGARVGGFVCAWDATVHNPEGTALVATGMRVEQDVLFDRGFVASGEVDLSNAQIGTVLALDGAKLGNPGRTALRAERLVADAIHCRAGFTSRGLVNLTGARVAAEVDLTDAIIESEAGPPLILAGLQAGSLTLRPATPLRGVDLRHTKVGTMDVDPASLPPSAHPTDSAVEGGHVFISYSRADRPYVEQLAAYLAADGILVWYDHELKPADRWLSEIREKIDSCAAFVLVMSPHSEQSPWVEREFAHAADLGKRVVALLLGGQAFWYQKNANYEDVTGGQMPSPRFVDRLRSLLAAEAASVSQPTPPEPVEMEIAVAEPISTRTESADFDMTWQRIVSLAGETFHTKTGLAFTYSIHGTSLLPDRTDYPLHVSQFRLAFERLPLAGPGDISNVVRGPSYIYAILTDPRIV
jgi:TIR domain